MSMMQYWAENPKTVANFGKTKWTASHTIAFGIHSYQMKIGTHRALWKQFFFKQKSNQFHLSHCGYLPIHLACQTNNATVLQLIIDTVSKQNLGKLLNHATQDKYWQFTPLMIAIENDSIDCVNILCNCDEIDVLNIKARYPNYNALQFACYYNNVDVLKIIISKRILSDMNVMDASTIFTSKMIDEMLEIAKRGKDRGSSHEKMSEAITHMLDEFGMAVESSDDASISTGFDYRTSRMRIINPSDYVCDNERCKNLDNRLTFLKSIVTCSLCNQLRSNDKFYVCGACAAVYCEDCAFLVSINENESKDNFSSLGKNHEFITLLRNDEKIVRKV